MFNCKWTESVLAIVIIVFALWPALISSAVVGKWIVIVAAALILIHGLACNHCGICAPEDAKGKGKKKKK